jgi:hypothetical protein
MFIQPVNDELWRICKEMFVEHFPGGTE